MPVVNGVDWEAFLAGWPEAHLLQTAAWGDLKAAFGWQVERVTAGRAGAQILFRGVGAGLTLGYIPRGPVGEGWQDLWPAVDRVCRRRRAIFLKVEPDAWEPLLAGVETVELAGFQPSPQAVQPLRTVTVSLVGDEDSILARMKQKTRYNIRLAEKKEVQVRAWDDLVGFHQLMQETGARDVFGVHSLDYYRRVYAAFYPREECELLVAEYAGQPLAALFVFARGARAWYLYGASGDRERSRMPAYLLQWEAMRWARRRGCLEYDLWGVPDEEEDVLEAQFETRQDGLWGVYRFKRGFGGTLRRSAAARDRVYQPLLYRAYRWWLRRRGMEG